MMEHHETGVAGEKMTCKLCGAELWDGASFCTHCGNVIGAEYEVGNWNEREKHPTPKCPTTIGQKLVSVLAVVTILYGVCVILGGKKYSQTVGEDVSLESASAAVSSAEKRIEDLEKAIADEDARRLEVEREKAERFHRDQEEARRLRLELNEK